MQPDPEQLKVMRGRQIARSEFYRRALPAWPHHRLQCQIVGWMEEHLPHLSHLLIAVTGLEKAPARYYERLGKTHRHAPMVPLLQAEGVRYGVPPLFLALPRGGYHGLWLGFLKKPRDNRLKCQRIEKPAAHELPHVENLRGQGFMVYYVNDVKDAAVLINQYVNLLTL